MLFVEPRFFAFFAAVFLLYWSSRRNAHRKLVILGASYLFYSAWDWRFTGLLAFCTVFDYVTGLAMERTRTEVRKRLWITFSVCVNLGLLFTFKYFNFFAGSFAALLQSFGLQANPVTLSIILPVGISFYTFQSLSYTIEIYRGHLRATRSLLDYATFVAFFPQLVAGPIVRAYDFLPQLARARRFGEVPLRPAVVLFLFGFVKKACISDNLAPYVDAVFSNPSHYDGMSLVLGVMLYAVQIYGDFSGYTDMAIATAAFLGYRLTVNFDTPYLAANVADFWRRWHISLSSWLRDYLYVSLGGNRGGRLATHRNLMTTMLLGGLWHGASWNFLIWGALHGGALIVHRIWAAWCPAFLATVIPYRLFAIAATFWFVCLAWIFFRAGTLASALDIAARFTLIRPGGAASLGGNMLAVMVVLALLHWLERRKLLTNALIALPRLAFYAGAGAFAAISLAFVPLAYRPFIYFQF